ncbi:MAG: hypothetical protein ACRENF_02015, partial [Thermodesulfobacteriota bacterium]
CIPIRHRWTYIHYNSLLRRDEDGRYYVDEGTGRVYAHIEDTPFVVRMVHKRGNEFYMILNDESEEMLDLDRLWINEENIPYTRVKGGEYDARFSRPAYYEISRYLIREGDRFYIEYNNKKYYLQSRTQGIDDPNDKLV